MNPKTLQQSCVGLLLILIGGCSSPETTPTSLAPGPTVPAALQPTELLESETPETTATEAIVLEEPPLYGAPAICPQGGGDPPVIGRLAFETGVMGSPQSLGHFPPALPIRAQT